MIDTDWLRMAIYIFLIVFLSIMGERKSPWFLLFAGVVGLAFAFDLYTVLSNFLISGITAGMSLMIFSYGLIVRRPKDKVI